MEMDGLKVDGPLVSICLTHYNQRRWVGAAVKSVLAQTYRPLEVLVSDDASDDGSHEIVEAVIAAHAPPDVKVVYRRNGTNLGNYDNWDELTALARGELIVKADGDDISLPDRVTRIVEAWQADGCRAAVIAHAAFRIDADGRPLLGVVSPPTIDRPCGMAMAWRRDCYTVLPAARLGREAMDDMVPTRRGQMLGGYLAMPEPLVLYRIGTGLSTSLACYREPALRSIKARLVCMEHSIGELEQMRSRLSPSRYESLRNEFEAEVEWIRNQIVLMSDKSVRRRLAAARRQGARLFSRRALSIGLYLLPQCMGDVLFDTAVRIRTLISRVGGRLRRPSVSWQS